MRSFFVIWRFPFPDARWHLHSLTYLCTCSVLMSFLLLYQLLEESQINVNFQSKDTSLVHSSHNFTPKRNVTRFA
jgi:hypothetical protein